MVSRGITAQSWESLKQLRSNIHDKSARFFSVHISSHHVLKSFVAFWSVHLLKLKKIEKQHANDLQSSTPPARHGRNAGPTQLGAAAMVVVTFVKDTWFRAPKKESNAMKKRNLCHLFFRSFRLIQALQFHFWPKMLPPLPVWWAVQKGGGWMKDLMVHRNVYPNGTSHKNFESFAGVSCFLMFVLQLSYEWSPQHHYSCKLLLYYPSFGSARWWITSQMLKLIGGVHFYSPILGWPRPKSLDGLFISVYLLSV